MFSVKSPVDYIQQAGLRYHVGEYIRPFTRHLRILTSPSAWEAVNPALSESLDNAGIRWQREDLIGECTEEAVRQFQDNLVAQEAEGILAIGGGRVMDTAKAVNNRLGNKVLITLPTQAATCAAWSPLAIIYNAAGGHVKSQVLNTMPVLILVDSEIIAHSPVRYLRAGIVDAMAKWYEFEPYQRQNPDALALNIKVSIARQAIDIFLRWGEDAIEANQQRQVTQALEKVIEANIVLAGLANSVRGPLVTPAFAHIIHDTLTHQPEIHTWLHGEKVGYSLLIQSLVENRQWESDGELLTLLRRFHSPLRLPTLSGERSKRIQQIVNAISFPVDHLRDLPFGITSQGLLQAFLTTDNHNFQAE